MATVNLDNTAKMRRIKEAFEAFNADLCNIDSALWADDVIVQGCGTDDKFCKVYYIDGEVMIDGLGNEVL